MEIYLKNELTNVFRCIKKDGKDVIICVIQNVGLAKTNCSGNSIELIRFNSTPPEKEAARLMSKSNHVKSNKAEFMAAYAEAKNTLHTFQLSINPK